MMFVICFAAGELPLIWFDNNAGAMSAIFYISEDRNFYLYTKFCSLKRDEMEQKCKEVLPDYE